MRTKTEVTPEINKAIRKAVEAAGSQMEFSRKSGVNQPTINMLLNGRSRSITSAVMTKLAPFLAPYLSAEGAVGNIQLIHAPHGHHLNAINGTEDGRIGRVLDAVMASDLPPECKVKVYNLIKETK